MKNQEELYNQQLVKNFHNRKNPQHIQNFLMVQYLTEHRMFEEIEKFHLLPIRADVEPSTRCFLHCRYCQVPNWDRKELDDLSFEKFKMILDKIPQIFELKLQGQGEPLLNRDFFRMVKYATDQGIIVKFYTNGMLLDEKKCKQIIESGLFEMRISLDGSNAEIVEVMRSGLDFDKVVHNVKRLVNMRGENQLPLINVWTLVTKKNLKDIPNVIKLCHDLGVDGLKLQIKLSTRENIEIEAKVKEDTINIRDPKVQKQFDEFKNLAKKLDLDLELQLDKWRTKENPCRWLWNAIYVSVEGSVVPCCIISNPEKLNYGNLLEHNFEDIWFSEPYHSIREDTLNMIIHKQCKWCYLPIQYND